MLGPKKIHTRNVIRKKNSFGSKIPPPPTLLTFLMVRPLQSPESILPTVSDIRDAQNHGTTDSPTLSSYEDEDQPYAV